MSDMSFKRYNIRSVQTLECTVVCYCYVNIPTFPWNTVITLEYIDVVQQCGTVELHCVAKFGVLTNLMMNF